jgi:hypothetical protein
MHSCFQHYIEFMVSLTLWRPYHVKKSFGTHWMGYAVAQLVEALRYKGRGFDSRWCHWKFLLA